MSSNNDKKRVLITGVSGLLGNNLAALWKDHCEILGIFNSHPLGIAGVRTQGLDLLSGGQLRQVIKDFRPQVVLHTAALADVEACEGQRERALQMNCGMVTCVVDALAHSGAKLVHISTDAFYNGDRKGPHTEEEPIDSANYYGYTKYLGELEALKYPDALVVRTAFFGRNVQAKQSFIEQIIAKLAQGQRIKGFTNSITSMIHIPDLADLIYKAIEKNLKGVYNFGCGTSMSKHDFAVRVAGLYGLDASLIDPMKIEDFPFKAPRAKDLSLNVSKLAGHLGQRIVSLEESVRHFKESGEK